MRGAIFRRFRIRALSFPCFASHVVSGNRHKSFSAATKLRNHEVLICNYLCNRRLDEAREVFNKVPSPHRCCLIELDVECGDTDTAVKLFDEMPEKSVVSWTAMLNGFLRSAKVEQAEGLFYQMLVKDTAAWNAMVHGYLQFGRVDDALELFEKMPRKNVISWTTMICGLDQNERSGEALVLFKNMMSCCVKATSRTFTCVVPACANAFHTGRQVHGFIIKLGFLYEEYVSAWLITFYANCKRPEDSRKMFDEKAHDQVAVWTALLSGYRLYKKHEDALSVFLEMLRNSILPNQSTFASGLNSCSALGTLDWVKERHGVAVKLGLGTDAFINLEEEHCLVEFYYSWLRGKWAFVIYGQMIRFNREPDEITFTGLLSAGFYRKEERFSITCQEDQIVSIERFNTTLVWLDILGRSGKLKEAQELIEGMLVKPNEMVRLALLGVCRMHSDVDRAEKAAASFFKLDSKSSAVYVLLSNTYASAGRWSNVSKLRIKMKQKGIMKKPGSSWVVFKGKKHEFFSGDRPQSLRISEKLEFLKEKLKELGYVPDY
ncbi:hypothetical protein F2Q70_00031474 [Brassica cretica]|uniref:Smr domain-containing protein n=1 Tax=Brassica cretica TaxID=69181 RepID=A0A8S9FCH2_BRACR|nr:hypothetical protein F2Q70_00031474 [Brassica cretica]